MWRGPHINRALMHEDALRKREALGKDGRSIKNTIAILIDQPQHPMTWVLELSRGLVRVPGAIRDVEHAILIETHVNGPLHQGRRSNLLQGVAVGNGKCMRSERDFLGVQQG